jgi:hypothetical protein
MASVIYPTYPTCLTYLITLSWVRRYRVELAFFGWAGWADQRVWI